MTTNQTSPSTDSLAHYPQRGQRVLRMLFVSVLFLLAAVGGSLIGLVLAYQNDSELLQQLESYEPSIITQVFGEDNKVIAEFALEKRVVITFENIPVHFQEALVASEDQRFWKHYGFDPVGITRAVWDSSWAGEIVSGASTITQQLAGMLFLDRSEVTLTRKIREAILAFKIDRAYTKFEILTFYCNMLHFGHGLYGVEAAADYFFGKNARDLSIEESALLVGIAPSPNNFSPFINPETALKRRDQVLRRMRSEGFLTAEEAARASNVPIQLRRRGPSSNVAPYFVEEVRQYLEEKYGSTRIYRGGLRVHTTLNHQMQEAANRAIDSTLRALDKRQGFRSIETNVLEDMETSIQEFHIEDWVEPFNVNQILRGVVTENGRFPTVRIGRFTARIDDEDVAWTKQTPAAILKVGDVTQFRIKEINSATSTISLELEQEPLVEGALAAIDVRTGQIKAMVGGFDFDRSKFNRATQAMRQPGSAFKAFAVAAALDEGYTPTSLILDAPVRYEDPHIEEAYEPHNYDEEYEGWVTLRRMVEGSRNIPAVRLTHQIGPEKVAEMAHRLGLNGPIPPYLSVTLGSAEATLLEMVSGYSAFANQGIRMRPYFVTRVTDRDGNVLEETYPTAASAIRADTAYLVTNLLSGVVQRGTARQAARLGRPLAGKTGTTNDYTDAWFLGFDPTLAAGVWVGFDQKLNLGEGEVGARAALPAWIEFIEAVVQDTPIEDFPIPSNIVFVPVDKVTGYPVDGPGDNVIMEAFVSGTEPAGYPFH